MRIYDLSIGPTQIAVNIYHFSEVYESWSFDVELGKRINEALKFEQNKNKGKRKFTVKIENQKLHIWRVK